MKTKNASLAALVLLTFFSPILISSVSASISSKNSERITSLNSINDEISDSAASDDNNDSVAITAEEYCEFLNAVAADDPHHLYDEKLWADSVAVCIDSLAPARLAPTGLLEQSSSSPSRGLPTTGIQRSGAPGHYTYVVTARKEEKSVLYIDHLSAMRYYNWLQNASRSSDNDTSITEHNANHADITPRLTMNPAGEEAVEALEKLFGETKSPDGSMRRASLTSTTTIAHDVSANKTLATVVSKESMPARSLSPVTTRRTTSLGKLGQKIPNNGSSWHSLLRGAMLATLMSLGNGRTTTEGLMSEYQLARENSEPNDNFPFCYKPLNHTIPEQFAIRLNQAISDKKNTTIHRIFGDSTTFLPESERATTSNATKITTENKPEEENFQMTDKDKRKKISSMYNEANKKGKDASDLWLRALDSSFSEQEGSLWQKSLKQTEEVGKTWSQIAEFCQQSLDKAPGEKKNWWKREIKFAEKNKIFWNDALSWRPSERDQLLKDDLRVYPYSHIIDFVELNTPELGQKTKKIILKTHSDYPYIYIEEVIDAATGTVISREKMIADHVLITLKDEEDPEIFSEKLAHPELNLSMEKSSPYHPFYKLHFAPVSLNSLTTILEATRSFGGKADILVPSSSNLNINSYTLR